MKTKMIRIILALAVLTTTVTLHEFGHYSAAKFYGITAEEFSLGVGPELIKSPPLKGTVFYIRAIPIGAYVKLPQDENKFGRSSSISAGQQAVICLAGPAINLITALILIMIANFKAIKLSFWENIKFSCGLFTRLVSFTVSSPKGKPFIENFSGPIGAVHSLVSDPGPTSTNKNVDSIDIPDSVYNYVKISFFSLSIGLFNLIPIPPLDGAKILVSMFELVFRRPLNTNVELVYSLIGTFLMVYFLIKISLLDIIRVLRQASSKLRS